jgi:short-subunit dehydrogenase
MSQSLGTALVTGASTGIGAVYADRLARRGYDLILVARDEARLNALAERLRAQAKIKVDVIKADLTRREDLAPVEQRLATDATITLLVNNAGASVSGPFETIGPDRFDQLIQLNVTSLTRLSAAVAPNFVKRGKGAIINIASVLAVAPEIGMPVYNATKAFVLSLSQSLNTELGPKGVYIQAVLPAATRTEIWERAGIDLDKFPPEQVMSAGDLVDAALAGFDKGETITFPPLQDEGLWQAFEAARKAMLAGVRGGTPAPRYRSRELVGAGLEDGADGLPFPLGRE